MNVNRKFRKYVVVLSDAYEKILKNSISTKNLTPEEKQLIEILNNVKLEPRDRAVKYQQLLFKQLLARTLGQNAAAGKGPAHSNINYRLSDSG